MPEHLTLPLLLQYGRTANLVSVNYQYDPELEVNIIIDSHGRVVPAVEGPYAELLTKTQTVVDGED
jgi:hypothetical protein